jgi:tRNA(Ile)-lysidine synthase TilS/MesJ
VEGVDSVVLTAFAKPLNDFPDLFARLFVVTVKQTFSDKRFAAILLIMCVRGRVHIDDLVIKIADDDCTVIFFHHTFKIREKFHDVFLLSLK